MMVPSNLKTGTAGPGKRRLLHALQNRDAFMEFLKDPEA